MTTVQIYSENGVEYCYNRSEFKRIFDMTIVQEDMTVDKLLSYISRKAKIPAHTIVNHLRPVGTKGACNPDSIDTVKKYGKFLKNDEYAFLKQFSMPSEDSEKSSEELQSNSVQMVFGMLYDILALYESSDCYNCIPNTDKMDGAWEYFEGLIVNVRKKLTTDLLGRRDSEEYQKLEQIIDETEIFIKSYSRPGVVKRWRELNPQINYFDCVFDLIDELGLETALKLYSEGSFAFFPSDYIIKARDMYFAEKAMRNADGNLRYTETRLFQNELLQTLAMVFENDFGGGEGKTRIT